jgi:hypothetical protein
MAILSGDWCTTVPHPDSSSKVSWSSVMRQYISIIESVSGSRPVIWEQEVSTHKACRKDKGRRVNGTSQSIQTKASCRWAGLASETARPAEDFGMVDMGVKTSV